MDVGRQKLRCQLYSFRTEWMLDIKNWGKITILVSPPQPFRAKWMLDIKNWCKITILRCQL